jgi:threonylcarbamoyladenosine tRNA methylthiotransferase MtaB
MAASANENTRIRMLTFGCRLNAFESEFMAERAREAGLGQLPDGAVIVNSCAVTGEAVRQARQAIRKARREQPRARIIVTGCAAQTEPDTFAAMDEVDLVLGNSEKLRTASYRALPEFGINRFAKNRVGDIMEERTIPGQAVGSFGGRARAFVQVQNGCDHRCTFCVIPYGRGNSRSLPAEQVVSQVAGFVSAGFREIVLTGVDTTSWGGDLAGRPKLGRLVATVLERVPQLERLRLSSIDSIEADDELVGIIGEEERFMPHLHLSLQHGNDLILKRMKRRHLRADAMRFCDEVRRRRPGITLGADLIAGFPTETEAMFADTLDIVKACGLTFLHVFPFSPRPMTPAARMPQLDRSIVAERAARLRRRGDEALVRHLDQKVGKIAKVLIERNGTGKAEDNTPVGVERMTGPDGTVVQVRVTGHDGRVATAVVAPSAAKSAA